MNAACPRAPRSRSTEAITTWTSAIPPLVAHAFWPLITHSSAASSYLAVVRIADTSEPASGFRRAEGRHLGVVGGPEALPDPFGHLLGRALAEDGATASDVPMIDIPIPASPQKSSSLTIGSINPDWSNQNCARPS